MISAWLACYLTIEYFKAKKVKVIKPRTVDEESDSDGSIQIPDDLN